MCPRGRSKIENFEEMDFSLMKKIITDCSDLSFTPLVHFSGYGEPLAYPEIQKAMQLCNKRKLKWSVNTNGFFLEKYAEDFVINNCSHITVSVHGDPLEHDKTTGVNGSFDKAFRGIIELDQVKKRLKKRAPLIAIVCVITNNNVLNLKNILGTFMKAPVNSITFEHTFFTPDDIEKRSDFLIREEDKLNRLIEFIEFIEYTKNPIRVYMFPKIEKRDIIGYYTDKDYKFPESCIVPWLSVAIFPDGDVKFCNQFLVGNLKNDSLKSIINSREATKFRDLVRKGKLSMLPKPPSCFRCCFRHYC